MVVYDGPSIMTVIKFREDDMKISIMSYVLVIVIAVMLSGGAETVYAFHDSADSCPGCHNWSASSGTSSGTSTSGQIISSGSTTVTSHPYNLIGSDQSSTCLRCHAAPYNQVLSQEHYVMSIFTNVTSSVIPAGRTPGGDFAWIKVGNAAVNPASYHGHNIVALDYGLEASADYVEAPGGSYPSSSLACSSCHDPHGTGVSYRRLGGVGYTSKGAPDKAFTKSAPIAVAPSKYNRSEASTDTRVAYGKGMSEWCKNCHPLDQSHPSGDYSKLTKDLVSNYNTFINTNNYAGKQETAYTSLVPFEEGSDDTAILSSHAKYDNSQMGGPKTGNENVMCLTCHRAHASGWPHIFRWNSKGFYMVVDGAYPGIDAGTEGGKDLQVNLGYTQAQTRAAYYDRPASRYASMQKSLCNKCHLKD